MEHNKSTPRRGIRKDKVLSKSFKAIQSKTIVVAMDLLMKDDLSKKKKLDKNI